MRVGAYASLGPGRRPWGCTKVRTGIGKPDLPGSQGGLWKRGDEWSRTEAHRETAGYATVPCGHARAAFLSRLLQDMTKSLGCDMVIAEDVCRRAIPPERFVGWREAAGRAAVAA